MKAPLCALCKSARAYPLPVAAVVARTGAALPARTPLCLFCVGLVRDAAPDLSASTAPERTA